MNKPSSPSRSSLPHHRLIVHQRAIELLLAVLAASIRDAKLRDEATRAAKGTCCNIAEGSACFTRGEKKRAYSIARGEAVEAVAVVEIAALTGDTSAAHAAECTRLGNEVYAMLSALLR